MLLSAERGWGQTNNYFGTSGTLTGSVWSINPGGPYTSALATTGGAIINFGNATTTITGASIVAAGINATANATITTAGGTITTYTNGVIVVDVSNGITLDFGTQSMTTSATAGFTKNNTGVFAMAGGTYGGGFTLNSGTIITRGVNAMGGNATPGALTINGGIIASNATRDFSNKYSGITVGGDFTFGATTGLASSTANLTFNSNITLGSASRIMTIGGTGTYTLGGIISGTGTAGLTVNSTAAGVLLLTAINTYPGTTTVTGGDLRLNPSGNLTLAGACTFNGGTLSTTGIASTRTITFSSINISDNSTLQLLASTDHKITFTSLGTLTPNKILTIKGWTGSYVLGTTGAVAAAGKVFIGNSASLTANQLAQIRFNNGTNNYAATQLSTGELVPTTVLVVTNPGNQTAGVGFNVTVTAKDLDGNARALTNATGITLTSNGTIGGTTTGSIAAAGNTVTISGVTLAAGTGLTITATRSSGDQPIAGTSGTFDVIAAASAPSVTSSAPDPIGANRVTFNGNVTSDGGAAVTDRGFVYKLSAGVTISDNKTQVGSGTGAFSTNAPTLSVNIQYFFKAYAINTAGTTLSTPELDFYTLANTPSAPVVASLTSSSLSVTIGTGEGNPSTTENLIQETGSGNYVQDDGTLGASPVWQTKATWGTKTVTGLLVNTSYTFQVKARNGSGTETAFGSTAAKYTLAYTPGAPTVNGATTSSLDVTLNTNSNPVSIEYAIQETGSGNYLQSDGTLGASAIWQTEAIWGTKTVTGLSVNTSYTFKAKARNAENAETVYGNTTAKYTLAYAPGTPTVNNPTSSTLDVLINANSNPAATTFAIHETSTDKYVQANGSLNTGAVWQTAATWGTKTVNGLAGGTTFTFEVKARNGDNAETAFGGSAGGTTTSSVLPTLTTPTVAAITNNSATLGATITSDGGAAITFRGTVYDVTPTPVANPLAEGGIAVAAFSHSRSGLTPNTLYYYAGYATNSVGTAYSPDGSFTTKHNAPTSDAASAVTTGGFTANWTAPTGGGSETFTYTLQYSTTSDFTSGNTLVSAISSSNLSQAVAGLNPGQQYWYRVLANNAGGDGAWSLTQTVTVTANPPTVASPTVSGITTTSATLGATVTSDGGGALINRGTVFDVTANPTANALDEGGTTVGAFTHSRSGMIPNTIYFFRGYSTNGSGLYYSPDGSFTTLQNTPTSDVATAVTTSGFTANWFAPTGGGSATFTYTLQYSTTSDFTSGNTSVTLIASSNLSQAVSGLGAGIQFWYRVLASNAGGNGAWSGTQTVTTLASIATLTLPTATAITTTTATLGATVTSNGGGALISRGTVYDVSASPTANAVAEGGTAVSLFTQPRTGFTPNTFYYYRGYAENSAGFAYSPDGSFTTKHNAPTSDVATALTTGGFTANWFAPTGGGSATFTYTLQYSTTSDFTSGNTSITGISSANLNQPVSSLVNGTEYWYRVLANNAGGDGAWSGTQTLTTLASLPAVTSPTSAAITTNTATLGATVSYTGGATITRGVVWAETSLNPDPTIGGASSTDLAGGTGTGIFTVSAIALPAGTSISYKGYATNTAGAVYTSAGTFTTLAVAPGTAATLMTFSNTTINSILVGWTPGDGANRIVVARLNATTRVAPANAAGYAVNSASFTDGLNVTTGTGNVVIYNGSGATVNVTGLSAATLYAFDVYEYNGSGASANYLTSTYLSSSKTTLYAEPVTQATNVTFTNVSSTGFKINWTLGSGTSSIVLVKDVTAVDADPLDGTTYTNNSAFGTIGTEIGTGNFVVYKATLATIAITGLLDGHTYHVAVYTYNGSGGLENYLTTTPATGSQLATTPIYYSKTSGDPAVLTNWNSNRDGVSGATPPDFTTTANFLIQNAHNMTTTATLLAFGGAGSTLEIESGGTLTAPFAVTIATGATFKIDGGGTYVHNNTGAFGSTIFKGTENFANTSTVILNNSSTTGPSGTTFGNLTINFTTAPSGSVNCSGGITTINGDLTVQNTQSLEFRLSGNTAYNISIVGDLIVSGGILNFSSGTAAPTVTINGSFNQSGGTVTSSIGTSIITFAGSNKTFTESGTLTNTNINWAVNSGASLTLNNALPVATSRNLTINGTVTCGTNAISGLGTVIVNNGGTLKVGSLNAGGAIAGNVTASGGVTLNTGSTVEYNGSGAQYATARTFSNLTINNTSGVTLNSVSNDITVNGNLNLSSSKITTGANKVIISSAGSVTRTSGYVAGNLQKHIATGATVATFEIGGASIYRPVSVSFGTVSTAGELTAAVSQAAGNHANLGSSTMSSTKNVARYFTLTNTGIIFDNYNATFNFDATDIVGGANPANFIVGKYNGTSWAYPTVGTKTSTSTGITGVTSFSDFVLGESKISTTTTADNKSVCYGSASVDLTATVSPDPAGGSVEFFVDGSSIGSVTVGASGIATKTYNPSGLSAAGHTVKANFSGYGEYLSSSSDPATNGTLTVIALPSAPGVSVAQPTCGSANGSVSITSSTAGLTFSTDGTNFAAYAGPYSVAAGAGYSITAKLTSSGCVSPATTGIMGAQPITPSAPTLSETQSTCGNSNGSVAITSTTAGLTFSTDGTNYSAYAGPYTVAAGAGYSITAKLTSSGCVSAATTGTMGAQPVTPSAPSVSETQPACGNANGSVAVTSSTAGLTFSTDGITYAAYAGPYTIAAGAGYSITAKLTSSGCVSAATAGTMGAPTPSAPSVSETQPTCGNANGSVAVTSSTTGLTFSTDGTNYTAYAGPYTVSAGTGYSITAKLTSSGCVSAATTGTMCAQQVTPSAPSVSETQPTCGSANGSVAITSQTTGLTFSTDGITYAAYAGPYTVAAGAGYSITAKLTSGGCVSAATTGTMGAQPITPSAPTVSVTQPTCGNANGSVAVTSSTTGLTFSIDGNTYAAYAGPYTVSAGAGYSITAKLTSSGCVSAATTGTMGAQPATPTATILNNTGTTILTITNSSISVTAGGGVSYVWTRGATPMGTDATLLITSEGTYTVTATSANGCTDTESIVITQGIGPPTAKIDIALVAPSCSDFEVKLRPTENIVGDITDVQFTVKWPVTSPNVSLSNIVSANLIQQGTTVQSGGFNYAVFAGMDGVAVNWTAGTAYTVLTFSHDQAAAFGTNGDFTIGSDTWTTTNNGVYYAEATWNVTGTNYANAEGVALGKCPLTIAGTFTANNKMYDGNRYATFLANNLTLSGVVGGDNVAWDKLGTGIWFSNQNVANGKTVSIYSVPSPTGTDASRYQLTLSGAPTTLADITPVSFSLKVMLQGPYNDVTGLMKTDLYTAGMIPSAQPFNTSPWNYAGTETATPVATSVDWVLVELRSTASGAALGRSAGLLSSDGTISFIMNSITFPAIHSGSSYYVVVWHRNHMPVMSATAVAVPVTGYDFTSVSNCYLSGAIRVKTSPDVYAMIAGEVLVNGNLKYSGPASDRAPIILRIVYETGSSSINGYTLPGYWQEDATLNSIVAYNSSGNDRARILSNLGALTGNSYMNSVYASVVPFTYPVGKSATANGFVDIQFTDYGKYLSVELATRKTVETGTIDNVQFTLAWKAGDIQIEKMLAVYTSTFNATPQGSPVEMNGIMYQAFVSATPTNLPSIWNMGEKLPVITFDKPSGEVIGERLWVAGNNYTEASNGDYFVSNLGTDITGNITIPFVGTINPEPVTSVALYPNPLFAGSPLYVKIATSLSQTLDLEIWDMKGSLVKTDKLLTTPGTLSYKIDVTGFNQGVYLIKLHGGKVFYADRFVIN